MIAYSLFDKIIQINSASEAVINKASAYFYHHLTDLAQPADIYFDIPHIPNPLGFRALVRDRPSDDALALSYIRYRLAEGAWHKWQNPTPPLIPYFLECINKKFAGYHAAALALPDKDLGCLILGDKEAGKSTTALTLCREYHWRIIADETRILELATNRLRKLLRPPHLYSLGGQKIAMDFNENAWLHPADCCKARLVVELINDPA